MARRRSRRNERKQRSILSLFLVLLWSGIRAAILSLGHLRSTGWPDRSAYTYQLNVILKSLDPMPKCNASLGVKLLMSLSLSLRRPRCLNLRTTDSAEKSGGGRERGGDQEREEGRGLLALANSLSVGTWSDLDFGRGGERATLKCRSR